MQINIVKQFIKNLSCYASNCAWEVKSAKCITLNKIGAQENLHVYMFNSQTVKMHSVTCKVQQSTTWKVQEQFCNHYMVSTLPYEQCTQQNTMHFTVY